MVNTPLIPALGRERQVDLCEFKASLVYKSEFQDRLQSHRETLSQPPLHQKMVNIAEINTTAWMCTSALMNTAGRIGTMVGCIIQLGPSPKVKHILQMV